MYLALHQLAPNRDRSNGQQRREAGCEPLLTDDQTALRLRKPGKCPFGLDRRDADLDGFAPRFFGISDPLWALRQNTTFAELLAEVFGNIFLKGKSPLNSYQKSFRKIFQILLAAQLLEPPGSPAPFVDRLVHVIVQIRGANP